MVPVALLAAALAVPPDRTLTWEVHVGSATIGTRTASVHYQVERGKLVRIVESWTDLQGSVGPVSFSWQQRLTLWGGSDPAAFHSVIKENGTPREVQGRWDPMGWTITTVDPRAVATRDVPSRFVDLSTADLIDPGSRYSLFRLGTAHILSAETGDVWEGPVETIGTKELTIGGQKVPVEGVSWVSPEGRTEFWYNSEGWLVQYRMRVLGYEVEGVLREPPPPGVDEFPVIMGGAKLQVTPL
ncbi:MAG TPA: DUF6134 family protein [Myxococcota bacterium]|nr:DUF6134 family protein [Myxococcota bacterium]